MDSNQDVDLLSKAIENLLEEKRKRGAAGDTFIEDDDDQLLLSRLLSQLESTKGNSTVKQPQGSTQEDADSPLNKAHGQSDDTISDNHKDKISAEEIAKEMKKLKRQNTITHLLLSAMILLTLTWQVGEFSVILKVKDSLSHPFRNVGNGLLGMIKGRLPPNNQLLENPSPSSKEEQNNHIEAPSLPSFEVPELLKDLGLNNDE